MKIIGTQQLQAGRQAINCSYRPEVVRVMTEEMGLKTKHMDSDVIYRMAAFWNDRDTEDVTNGQNIQLFMEELVCSIIKRVYFCVEFDF